MQAASRAQEDRVLRLESAVEELNAELLKKDTVREEQLKENQTIRYLTM